MKLRWMTQYENVWEEFNHEGGMKDGGYKRIPTGEKVLQFYHEIDGWVDVPTEI